MFEIKRSFAIIIGIDRYESLPQLKSAAADAADLAQVLTEYGYQVLLLLNRRATGIELNKLMVALQNKTIPLDNQTISLDNSDRILFYFAGHGFAQDTEEEGVNKPSGYLMPQDAQPDNSNTWLSMQQLYETLSSLGCHHLLIILDCCFAGRISWVGQGRNAARSRKLYRQSYERFIKHRTEQIITSAAYDEEAQDLSRFGKRGEQNGHSPFADLFLKVLRHNLNRNVGKDKFLDAIVEDGVITVHELFTYLQNKLGEVAPIQTPGLAQPRKYDPETGQYVYFKGEYIFPLQGFQPKNLQKLKLDRNTNPYKGLASFDTEDSYWFFGRKTLSQQLCQIVAQQPLTIVLGASGSGKSSVVKAGVVATLKAGVNSQNFQQWQILNPMRPGESPLKALHNILTSTKSSDFSLIQRTTQEQSSFLLDKISHWIKSNTKSHFSKFLIVIDQAEELLTICQSKQERTDFLGLLTLLLAKYPQLRIILTLRADFEPQLRDALKDTPKDTVIESTWQKAWQRGRFFVTPMNREELQQVIEEPAAQRTLFFESPKLVNQLIDEVINTPGALPLLSFTLSELYLKYLQQEEDGIRDDRTITETDYQKLGGVARSLTQTADRTYLNLVGVEKIEPTIIRNVLLRMVSLSTGELARRRVSQSELVYPESIDGKVQQVINCFVVARLLTTGLDTEGKEYVEPVHDVLVTGWQKILSWKQEQEASLMLQRRLTVAAESWNQQLLQTPSNSANSLAVEPVLNWLDGRISQVENLVEKLSKRIKRSPKFQNIPFPLSSFLTPFSSKVSSSSPKPQQFLWNSDPYLAVLNLELQSQNNWLNQLETEFLRQSIRLKRRNISWRWRIAISLILVLSSLLIATAIFLGLSKINQAKVLRESAENSLQANQSLDGMKDILSSSQILQSPGLQLLLSLKQLFSQSDLQQQVRGTLLRAVYTVKESDRQNLDRGTVRASFSPDGTKIISGGENGMVRLSAVSAKNSKNLKQLITIPCNKNQCEPVKIARFSPDEAVIATAGAKGTIRLWKIQDSQAFDLNQWNTGQEEVKSIDFSPESQLLATTGANGTVILWDLKHNPIKPVKTFCLFDSCQKYSYGVVWSVAFSPDGRLLAYAGENGIIRLWKRDKQQANQWQEQILIPQQSDSEITSIAFSRDGEKLASAGKDSIIRIWALNKDNNTVTKLTEILTEQKQIWEVSFSPNEEKLASVGDNGTIVLWDLQNLPTKNIINIASETLAGHQGPVRSISFSPDGKQILSAGDDGSVRLWNLQGNELQKVPVSFPKQSLNKEITIKKGQQQAFGRQNGIVSWQRSPNQPIITMKSNHVGAVTSLAISPDGQQLASGGVDRTIRLWNNQGEQEFLLPIYGKVNSLAYSRDGQLLASAGDDDGMLQLWNLQDLDEGKPFAAWKAYRNSVKKIQFTEDGLFLKTIGEDSTTQFFYKLWSLESLNRLIKQAEARVSNLKDQKDSI